MALPAVTLFFKFVSVGCILAALFGVGLQGCANTSITTKTASSSPLLLWTRLPDLPNPLGFAGALSGKCGNGLVFAGGANFPPPTWTSTKHYDDGVWSLAESAEDQSWSWTKHQFTLHRPMGYAACGTFREELVCAGGQTLSNILQDAFVISCKESQLHMSQLPPMPVATSMGSSAVAGNQLWIIGGQTGSALTTATQDVWILDMSAQKWRRGPSLPSARVLSLSIAYNQHLYVMSGRRQQKDGHPEFLKDCWKLNISKFMLPGLASGGKTAVPWYARKKEKDSPAWESCADLPSCAMAGTIGLLGHDQIFVLGGDDGSHFGQDTPSNPGYSKKAYVYDTINDVWAKAGDTTEGEVTTTAIPWKDGLIINGGEVKPRVRTNHTWLVRTAPQH